MGWMITLGVLILLAILPLGVSARYRTGGVTAHLTIGPFRLSLYPGSGKRKKSKPQEEEKSKSSGVNKQQKETGGSAKDFIPLLQLLLELLQDLRRKLRVDLLELKVILAGSDPCDLAIHYGRTWAALGNLMPQLDRFFVIKKRNLEVECDFVSQETRILARLDVTITLGRLLLLVVIYGTRALKQYIEIANKRKGGAKA